MGICLTLIYYHIQQKNEGQPVGNPSIVLLVKVQSNGRNHQVHL